MRRERYRDFRPTCRNSESVEALESWWDSVARVASVPVSEFSEFSASRLALVVDVFVRVVLRVKCLGIPTSSLARFAGFLADFFLEPALWFFEVGEVVHVCEVFDAFEVQMESWVQDDCPLNRRHCLARRY